ncbi:unnamed protein product, partial [Staurois parvus]
MVGVTSQVQQVAGSAVPWIRQKYGQASQGFNRRWSAEVRIKAGSATRQEHRIPGTGAHGGNIHQGPDHRPGHSL